MKIQHASPRGRLRSLWIGLLMAAYVGGVAVLQPRAGVASDSVVVRAGDANCVLTVTQVFDQMIATGHRCDRGPSSTRAR